MVAYPVQGRVLHVRTAYRDAMCLVRIHRPTANQEQEPPLPPRRPGERDCIHDLTPESGHSMVLFALLLTILLGMAALAIDGSNAYLQQQRRQLAADAAALAGARAVALQASDSDVSNPVREFSSIPGATSATWRFTAGNRGVSVEVWRTFPTFFGSVVGQSEITVAAESEAALLPIGGTGDLLPMAVDCATTFNFGQIYQIWDKDDKKSSGGFGWLDWNGGSRGNPELADNIRNPANSGYWEIGDLIPSGPGVQNSNAVENALDEVIARNRAVTIPLYDVVSGNGSNTTYRVCGFAQFFVTDYNFKGNNKYVEGRFLQTLRSGVGDPGAPNRGVYTLSITR